MTDLQRAVAYLSATSLGRAAWCYQDTAQAGDLYVSSSDDLRDLGKRLRRGERDAYSRWCAETETRRPTKAERERVAS